MALHVHEPTTPLNSTEFFQEIHPKNSIYLHHTAGRADPNSSISWWNNPDSERGVSTPYLIGGIAPKTGNTDFDGKVIKAYDDNLWAFHLGVRRDPRLELSAIGIEICNAGWLSETADGFHSSALNEIIPDEFVVELGMPFRGSKFYHKYSNAQLDSLRELLIDLGNRFDIDLNKGLKDWIGREENRLPAGLTVLEAQQWLNQNDYTGRNGKALVEDGLMGPQTRWAVMMVGQEAFEYNVVALNGGEGVWTHTNVRNREFDFKFEKSDCSPQPELKAMLKSL